MKAGAKGMRLRPLVREPGVGITVHLPKRKGKKTPKKSIPRSGALKKNPEGLFLFIRELRDNDLPIRVEGNFRRFPPIGVFMDFHRIFL